MISWFAWFIRFSGSGIGWNEDRRSHSLSGCTFTFLSGFLLRHLSAFALLLLVSQCSYAFPYPFQRDTEHVMGFGLCRARSALLMGYWILENDRMAAYICHGS